MLVPSAKVALGSFALGGLVTAAVLNAVKNVVGDAVKETVKPLVIPPLRKATKSVIVGGLQFKQLVAEAAAEV